MNTTKCGDVWHLCWRVPEGYASSDPGCEVKMSVWTGSVAVAQQKAPWLWDQQVEM